MNVNGRGLVGGIAGGLLCPFACLIFRSRFLGFEGFSSPEDSIRFLVVTFLVGLCLGAIFGATVGSVEIRGRAASTIQAVAWGAVIGICVGSTLGRLSQNAKMRGTIGIFAGGAAGAYIGGMVAVFRNARLDKQPLVRNDGVRDHYLDG